MTNQAEPLEIQLAGLIQALRIATDDDVRYHKARGEIIARMVQAVSQGLHELDRLAGQRRAGLPADRIPADRPPPQPQQYPPGRPQ